MKGKRNGLWIMWREKPVGQESELKTQRLWFNESRTLISHAEIAGLAFREPEKKFEKMLVTIGDSLSDLASSDDGDDGEDEDNEETKQGSLSKDDEPGWVMGTITKTVPQHMERFRQKQMMLHEMTLPGWEDAANFLRE
jgi:hypothetical protein